MHTEINKKEKHTLRIKNHILTFKNSTLRFDKLKKTHTDI